MRRRRWFYNAARTVRVCSETGVVERKYRRMNRVTGKEVKIVWKTVDAMTLSPALGGVARRARPEDARSVAQRAV